LREKFNFSWKEGKKKCPHKREKGGSSPPTKKSWNNKKRKITRSNLSKRGKRGERI